MSGKFTIVPGAILFDLLNGGDKDWDESPYPALGRRAFEAAGPEFALGSHGAGTGALTAQWKGGLGSASAVLSFGCWEAPPSISVRQGWSSAGSASSSCAASWIAR